VGWNDVTRRLFDPDGKREEQEMWMNLQSRKGE
jgi:hypothetical protein